MSQSHPVDALDLRADSYSADSKNIVLSLATIHSPERQTYSLPVTALYSFIADLQRLRPGASGELPRPPSSLRFRSPRPGPWQPPRPHRISSASTSPYRGDGSCAPVCPSAPSSIWSLILRRRDKRDMR